MAAAKIHQELPHSGSLNSHEVFLGMCRNGHDLSISLYKSKGKNKQPQCRLCKNAWNKAYRKKFPGKYAHLTMASWYRKAYGITLADYAEKLAMQKGLCAICKHEDKHFKLAVDHNHKTGQVRGLLCSPCNQTLGKVKESKEILHSMITYIEEWGG